MNFKNSSNMKATMTHEKLNTTRTFSMITMRNMNAQLNTKMIQNAENKNTYPIDTTDDTALEQ